ncbi:MAG: transketolase [Deltaproteobacteria bacterium]|nr:MAG: transketolase [Deltaproteobacteria bacterium]
MANELLCANTIRGLAMDAVQAANSGHPGMPMGMADAATVLWQRFLKHDPADPQWPDRDRFVLSAGHGSMLIYALLHLSGYDLSLEDIKAFRQWGSKTPGHPEYGHTPGVETTTGPLGQGLAMGVGMALTERYLRETFGADLVDHWTYGIVSDGDLMEGVASEAASLAGHLGLGRIVYLYDDNEISIEGNTAITFTEDRAKRFEAYGWHVQTVDGHDFEAVAAAIEAARIEDGKPSLICCRTIIGKGSAIQGSEKTHGAPLGEEDIRGTKERLGMDPDAHFAVPAGVPEAFQDHDGANQRAAWQARLDAHPRKNELLAWLDGTIDLDSVEWPSFEAGTKIATRKASAAALKAVAQACPWLLGGSADLGGSNGTEIKLGDVTREQFAGGRTLRFGVREHGMAAIANGMTLHKGLRPYVATFLVFHDYHRPSVRLSSLMNQPVVYIYTHDSIFLGEDGPTHQPIETMLAIRAIPGMEAWRPADGTETVESWKACLGRTDGPTAIVLTRQGLPVLDRSSLGAASGVHKGGYVLRDAADASVVLVATGSEVPLALSAADQLAESGIAARVVSMPCVERFLAQDVAYKRSVLPAGVPVVSIEAGATLGWERIVGLDGLSIGIDTFGASAPIEVLAEKFGLTAPQVADKVRAHLG